MKFKISTDYAGDGPPRWSANDVLHITPGDEFAETVNAEADRLLAAAPQDPRAKAYVERIKTQQPHRRTRRPTHTLVSRAVSRLDGPQPRRPSSDPQHHRLMGPFRKPPSQVVQLT